MSWGGGGKEEGNGDEMKDHFPHPISTAINLLISITQYIQLSIRNGATSHITCHGLIYNRA